MVMVKSHKRKLHIKKWQKITLSLIVGFVLAFGFAYWTQQVDFQVLSPQGEIANKQRDLLIFTAVLSLFVVIPVFVLLFVIAWRYREGNTKAKYRPDWDGNALAETIWWGLPGVIIVILSVVIWNSSHELDPYRKLQASAQPVNVQVVALQWRWLFIYPDEKIATINHLRFPERTPVNFSITADAPMNSFWIPKLGGMVYAMNGMSTKLHLSADTTGEYKGSSANLSGEGFAGMTFQARSVSELDYKNWVRQSKTESVLDWQKYEQLAKPSQDTKEHVFRLGDDAIYDKIIGKYMTHDAAKEPEAHTNMHSMQGM